MTPQNSSTDPAQSDEQQADSIPLWTVPGLNSVVSSDEHRRIFTRHIEVDALPFIGEAQRRLVKDAMDAFESLGIQDVSTGQEISSELNVRSNLTAASNQVIGIRTKTYQAVGGKSSNTYLTQWFSINAAKLVDSRDLFGSEDQWTDFREFFAQAAASNPEVDPGTLTDIKDSWLDSLKFDQQGNVVVEVDDQSISPDATTSITVTIPASKVLPLLSPFGLQARSAGMNPTPWLPSSATAMPSDSPQQTQTPSSQLPVPARPVDKTKRVDCAKAKCVALTFDDGPGPKTGKLLDDLKKANAPATFFVVGPNAKMRPEMLKRMIAEGHEVGNHTWSHLSLTSLNSTKIRSEIDRTNEAISAAIDEPATLLRPPYGARNSTTDRLAQAPVILWDVDTLDWKYRNADKVVSTTLSQTTPGSIVLMHDIHSSTVAAVPRILSGLKAKGYTFVTVSELLGHENLKSGETYSRAPAPGKGSAKNGGKK